LRLGELGGQLLDADSLASHASKRAWIDPDCLSLVESFGHSFAPADSPWEAEVGFTFADFAVAETGSVVIAAGAGRHRLASLASEIHVALIPATSIVATLEEAIARIGPRTSVIITGPSRTADIEGVLVRGIHGPRELVVVRY
jgi:L-lactate dehydrogenase complex protein LldG